MIKKEGIYHKELYCSGLHAVSDGERIFDLFLISDMRYCSNSKGIRWLYAKLEDRTGSIRAKIWSDKMEQEYQGYDGQIVIVSGKLTYYSGYPEVCIDKMVIAKSEEYVLSEVVKTLRTEEIRVYSEEIEKHIKCISNDELKKYMECIMNEQVLLEMSRLPVRLSGHHSYRGGMLKHICEVVIHVYYLIRSTAAMREIDCNMDLAIAGALLHDIGCLQILKTEGMRVMEKKGNKLQGESSLTYRILTEGLKKHMLSQDMFGELIHIVEASHEHGTPQTMEAMIVKSANQLSAHLDLYEGCCMENEYLNNETGFIWSRQLKQEIYNTRRKQNDGK